jgi:hypothetical protein
MLILKGSLQQLQSWMNWHSNHGANEDQQRRNLTKVDSTLTKYLSCGHRYNEAKLYQKIYSEKVNLHVKDKILKKGVEDCSNKMQIHREVVNILWEEDKDKLEVRETIDAARSCQVKKKRTKNKSQRTTKSRHLILLNMVVF